MATVAISPPASSRAQLAALPALALYVHIPWCVRKCPYCDFNSHELRGTLDEQRYLDALLRDLEFALPSVWGRRVHSIFFGGGTPSLLSGGAIERLLSAFRALLPLAADCEITLEANPGVFEAAKFRAYREAGVNRLSIGVQSFEPRHLKALGRIHDADEARRAIAAAQEQFDNINLDLMYALPAQSLAEARSDVHTARSFGAAHLSFYQLTIEPNTLFHRFPPPLPDDEAAWAMQEAIESELSAAGYGHYEISAWAKAGRQCRHNLNYWCFGDYLGIGAGAHSKISFSDRIVRQMRAKHPGEYMRRAADGAPVQEEHEVPAKDLAFEFMMNALRLSEGFPVPLFAERTGLPITAAGKALAEAEARGLIARDHARVRATELGRRFLNDLLQIFLPGQK
ncbi:MAG: oxygen-independent coproporphyrinogen III oxidase-like protein [Betaproteobacteria bacterium]|nr:oxygen-independent coproporphyrinogen III oxidase-like protein [Betaproteobacteria bacterium]